MKYTRNNLTQILWVADLEAPTTLDDYLSVLPDKVDMVYSDPPWNPGNATYWRTHAGKDACLSYNNFLDSWMRVVSECVSRGARHIFTEQSVNPKHKEMFFDAVKRTKNFLPFCEEFTVFYGSPGSAGCRNPNSLLHFGEEKLATDPSGMAGEPMTIRVCAGVDLAPGSWIVDPCMGKGMTSRMAHYFEWNCVGTELNEKRLDKTKSWLQNQNYKAC